MHGYSFSTNVFLPLYSAVKRPPAAVTSFTCFFFSSQCWKYLKISKCFLYRLTRWSMGSHFVNLLLKSNWAEKLFYIVILQAESEKSANSHLSHLSRFANTFSG